MFWFFTIFIIGRMLFSLPQCMSSSIISWKQLIFHCCNQVVEIHQFFSSFVYCIEAICFSNSIQVLANNSDISQKFSCWSSFFIIWIGKIVQVTHIYSCEGYEWWNIFDSITQAPLDPKLSGTTKHLPIFWNSMV